MGNHKLQLSIAVGNYDRIRPLVDGDVQIDGVDPPFVEDHLRAARKLMGFDFWSYGFAQNEHVVDRFPARHHAEGLSSRRLQAHELFHPASLESFKI